MTKPNSGRLAIIPAAAVFDHRLGHADVRVLAALGAHADKQGRCWPATTTLAEGIRVSTRQVRRCLRNLEDCGYLKTGHRPGRRSTYLICRDALNPERRGPRSMVSRRLSRTQRNLFWGLVTGDHRLKQWKGGKWSVEFLLDGYPCGGGLGVDPRTVQALIRAGWIDRDDRPVSHEVGIPSNA